MKTSNENPMDNDLHDLFVDQLRDILWAESHLVKALPKMAKAAQSAPLRSAFTAHLAETEQHVTRLKEIFANLGLSARAKKCEAMEGLLKEADELHDEYADTAALDAALITAAQKVEHYEIATYGTLRAFAQRMGHTKAVELLTQTLDEESRADAGLTKIAETKVNAAAAVPTKPSVGKAA